MTVFDESGDFAAIIIEGGDFVVGVANINDVILIVAKDNTAVAFDFGRTIRVDFSLFFFVEIFFDECAGGVEPNRAVPLGAALVADFGPFAVFADNVLTFGVRI